MLYPPCDVCRGVNDPDQTDTDGDGIISAEEEAAAFGIEEGEWWEEE